MTANQISGVLRKLFGVGGAWARSSSVLNHRFTDKGKSIGQVVFGDRLWKLISPGGYSQAQDQQALIAMLVGSGAPGGLESIDANQFSITIQAGNYIRVSHVNSLYSLWSTLNTENDQEPHVDMYKINWDLYSSSQFVLYPFLLLTENGDSITTTDVSDGNIFAAINNAAGASDHAMVPLGSIVSRPDYRSASTHYYQAKWESDLTGILQDYFKHCNRKEIQEENPLYLHIGVAVRAAPGAVVNFGGWRRYVAHQNSRAASLAEALK
jgi:hypothetical protein